MGRRRKRDKDRELNMPDAAVDEPREPSGSEKPFISPKAGLKIIGILSVGVLVLVWVSAPKGANWGFNLIISLIIIVSIWLVSAFAYTISKWLRSR